MRNPEKLFMQIARLVSDESTCIRKKVGCVLVRDNRIISIGYNGVASGVEHCMDVFDSYPDISAKSFIDMHGDFSRRNELHAEENCIAYCAKNGINTAGATLYVTLSPCMNCCKLIIAAGINEIIYADLYDRDIEGFDLLKQCDVDIRMCTY